ncbi:MAG: hypothetical protein ABW056_03790 [Thermoanaerobaculia bacterium]
MSRFSLSILAAAGLVVAAGCASEHGFENIAMTRDASVVASCEKVADLSAVPGRFDQTDAELQLQREAREKGANTVLVSDAEGHSGVAYRCSMPAVAQPGGQTR